MFSPASVRGAERAAESARGDNAASSAAAAWQIRSGKGRGARGGKKQK